MKLFFADCETTGLDNRKNEAFQFSFIIEIDGEVKLEKDMKFRPTEGCAVSREALEITGKTIDELKGYPDQRTAYNELIAILGQYVNKFDKKDKFVWIGQNAPFDTGFMRAFFARQGDKYFGSWFFMPADLISLAVACKAKGLINPADFKLGTLCALFDIELDAHDAMNDTRGLREVWHKLSGFLKEPAAV